MKLHLFLLFSLLCFNTINAADCEPGFVEDFEVLVMDTQPRVPIIGAQVNATYQLDYTTSKGYLTTPNKITNEKGIASLRFGNQEQLESEVDCEIILRVSFHGASAEETLIANLHPNTVVIDLDIYNVEIRVVDQYENPIEGAEVWVLGLNETTSLDGKVDFRLGYGEHKLFIKYEDGKFERIIYTEGDSIEKVSLSLYPFNLEIVDEYGRLLEATVRVGDDVYEVDGSLELEKLATASPNVRVEYGDKTEFVDVDLTTKTDYFVVFDLTAPKIGNISHEIIGNKLEFTIDVSDAGEYSSKIDSVKFYYKTSQEGTWAGSTVYPRTSRLYITSINTPPEGSDVFYYVEATDKAGNSVTFQDVVKLSTTENGGENGETSEESDIFSIVLLVVGVLIFAVVIYSGFKKLRGG